MKRKIAVCGNGWSNEFLEITMSGIRKYASENNIDVFFLLNYSINYAEEFKRLGDTNINRLLEFGDFDGVILLANTFHLQLEFDYLCHVIEEKNLPAVSLEYHVPNIDFLGSDNYSGMYDLCTHLVEHHNVKDVLFISGPLDNEESCIRRKALEDVLALHELTLEEDSIIFGNWNYYEVLNKLPQWLKSHSRLPDAIVCANDVMAMAVCSVLKENNISVPNDVKVTGFDHLLSVRNYYPTIASVDRNWENMGYQAMQYLLNKIGNNKSAKVKYFKSLMVPSESCGCSSPYQEGYNTMRDRDTTSYANHVNTSFWTGHLCDIGDNLSLISDEAELHNALKDYFVSEHAYEGDEFYFCLVDNFFSSLRGGTPLTFTGYPQQLDLIFGLRKGTPLERKTFATKELIPEYDMDAAGGRLFTFLPLYGNEGYYGHVVFGNELPMMYDYSIFNWTRSIVQNFNRVRQNILIAELNKQLEKLSVTDGLTGVYNRIGCDKIAYPFLEKCYSQGPNAILMFADINKMKVINDKYGHLQGDIAICTVANVIREVLQDNWIIVRYGGDEFLMVGECKDEEQPEHILDNISRHLEQTTSKMQLPYPLKIGVGYVLVNAKEQLNLSECLRKADEAMYLMKKRQHQEMQV